jgi:hypothetical protein
MPDWVLWTGSTESGSENISITVPNLLKRNIETLRLEGGFVDEDLSGILLEREKEWPPIRNLLVNCHMPTSSHDLHKRCTRSYDYRSSPFGLPPVDLSSTLRSLMAGSYRHLRTVKLESAISAKDMLYPLLSDSEFNDHMVVTQRLESLHLTIIPQPGHEGMFGIDDLPCASDLAAVALRIGRDYTKCTFRLGQAGTLLHDTPRVGDIHISETFDRRVQRKIKKLMANRDPIPGWRKI